MHKAKICHRDIKLANIAFFGDWDLNFIDFGLSFNYKLSYDKYNYSGTPGYIPDLILNNE
jgi:serine/threonine protein kinase